MKMIVINFKNYKEGKGVVKLAKEIRRYLPDAIVAVPAVSISDVVRETKLSVYAQSVDAFEGKRGTGKITALEVKKSGAVGTLLNHSENRMKMKDVKEAVKDCKRVGLKTLFFAGSLGEARKLISLKPTAIAYEDAKLVGSGKSVTKYKMRQIEKFVKLIQGRKIMALCGAGISSADDVMAAYRLGCSGVVIASAIANAKDPKRVLRQIANINWKEFYY